MESSKKSKLMVFVCVALMLILAMTSCSFDKEPNSNSEGVSEADDSGEEDQYGGVLRVGVTADAIVLGDPRSSFRQSDRMLPSPAIERLFIVDEDGETVPYLAEDYEVADDQSMITISLKQGVEFHDGAPFDAEAVKWNLDQYIDSGRAELNAVKSVEVVDEYTVELHLSRFDSLLLANLTGFPGMMISPKSFEENGEDWAVANPVGTGPFQFVEWNREENIVFERFDDYWQEGKPYLDGVEFVIIPDPSTLEAAYVNEEVDIVTGLEPRSAHDLEQQGYQIFTTSQPVAVMSLQPDSRAEDSIFHDVKVRQAVWHAIDMEAIAETLGYGYLVNTDQLGLPGSWAYNEEVEGYPYDPERAKELLEEAGYPDGFSTTLNGLNQGTYPDTLTATQSYLAEVGIDAELDLMSPQKFDEVVVHEGWSDGLTMIPFTVTPNELGAYSRLMAREVQEVRMKPVFASDETMDLIDDALIEADFEHMQEVVHELQKVTTDEYATVLWYYGTLGIGSRHDYVLDDNYYNPNSFEWAPAEAKIEK